MDTQRPRDFLGLCDMLMELKAELARCSADVSELKAHGAGPAIPPADRLGDPGRQLDVGIQRAVIKVPDITTVELHMPDGTTHFFHKCYMCKARFPSSFSEPKQCPRCGSHHWPYGKTKWDRKKPTPME